MRRYIKIALTMGDPCGIGPEVLAKALNGLRALRDVVFYLVGDSYVMAHYGLKLTPNILCSNLKNISAQYFKPGVSNRASAKASLEYLNSATALIKKGSADCLVTAPISKEAVAGVGFSWPGQTEFLAHYFKARHVEMVFISKRLKVALVTRHMALAQVIRGLKKERIVRCGCLMFDLLTKRFGIKSPKIAVCGLNPHAGEKGLFGKEEITQIMPAVQKLNKLFGEHFFGPLAADTVFHRAYHNEFDLVMAMYHDQGLIPFKMLEFQTGVHLTAGLAFIRTSPVHGTAFDIAGKNMANEASMTNAILLAYRLTKKYSLE